MSKLIPKQISITRGSLRHFDSLYLSSFCFVSNILAPTPPLRWTSPLPNNAVCDLCLQLGASSSPCRLLDLCNEGLVEARKPKLQNQTLHSSDLAHAHKLTLVDETLGFNELDVYTYSDLFNYHGTIRSIIEQSTKATYILLILRPPPRHLQNVME